MIRLVFITVRFLDLMEIVLLVLVTSEIVELELTCPVGKAGWSPGEAPSVPRFLLLYAIISAIVLMVVFESSDKYEFIPL